MYFLVSKMTCWQGFGSSARLKVLAQFEGRNGSFSSLGTSVNELEFSNKMSGWVESALFSFNQILKSELLGSTT
jgi:hypothetical protein